VIHPLRRAGLRRRPRLRADQAGATVAELGVALGIIAAISGMALPAASGTRDRLLADGGARHLASLVLHLRSSSVARGVHVALVFRPDGTDLCYAAFADANHNGVRATDISRGIDRQVTPWEHLADHFAGVSFGILAGVTDPDTASPLTGSPLRLGGSDMLSFGPTGGATSGTLYLRGRGRQQFAVRVLGTTGRSRLFRFDFGSGRWLPP